MNTRQKNIVTLLVFACAVSVNSIGAGRGALISAFREAHLPQQRAQSQSSQSRVVAPVAQPVVQVQPREQISPIVQPTVSLVLSQRPVVARQAADVRAHAQTGSAQVQQVNNDEEGDVCPLCYDKPQNPGVTSCCRHEFCRECWGNLRRHHEENLWSGNQMVCPWCRHTNPELV